MTREEFERAAGATRLKERARRLALWVLVEGLSAAEAGRREGVTRETARAAAARVLRAHREAGGYPRDWQTVTVTVPPETAAEIRELADAARRTAGWRA